MEEKMKRMRIASAGIALVAVMFMALLTGCPNGNGPSKDPYDPGTDPDNPNNPTTGSHAAMLTGITVAGVTPSTLPALIHFSKWDASDTALPLPGEIIVATSAASLTDAVISVNVSSKASYKMGKGYDHDRETITFDLTSPHTFSPNDFLYVQVISESGENKNYYKFQITTASANANLSTLTVAGESASIGSPAATWDTIQTPGSVSLTKTLKDNAKVVGTPAAATGTTIRYAKVANVPGAGAPTFAAADTFTFADGDFLYVEVTAADGVTKQIYKVEIEIGRNADLASISFGGRTANLGTGAATLAAVVRGFVVFTQEQPAGGFTVTITPADTDATIAYAAGVTSLAESAITTAYTAPVAIPVNDTEFLFVKVTSAGGSVVKYYKIMVGHLQKAFIKAGTPEIRASSQKYIDPIWDDPDLEVYQIKKIAPFGDTTALYRDQGEEHPRYTYGTAKALWDLNGMYLYVDVIDPEVTQAVVPDKTVTTSNAHEFDSFELFINENTDVVTSVPGTQTEFVAYSGQYRVGAADGFLSGHGPNALAAFTALNNASAWKKDDGTGYIIIMQAPWLHKDEAGLEPVDGKEIGFELQINACTALAARDGVMVWNNIEYSNYQTNTAFGVATLKGTPKTHAQRPRITTQPAGTFVLTGQSTTLSVVAEAVTDGGTLSYQWYSATTSGGAGTAVGTDSATYTPDTSTAGVTFYYVVVTNTNTDPSIDGNTVVSVNSAYARIEVGLYTGPVAGEWAERITSKGRNLPIYGFDLGTNKLGDFTKVTFKLKVDPDSPVKNGLVARVYAPVDVITPVAGNIALANTTSTGPLTEQLIANSTGQDISTYDDDFDDDGVDDDDWATYTLTMAILNGLADTTAMKQVTGLTGLGIGFFVNDTSNAVVSYYIKDIVLSNAEDTLTVDALYPGHALLWGGAGANKFGTIYGDAPEARELIGDTIALAPPFGTLLTDRFSATPTFQTYTYQGKTWWVFATTVNSPAETAYTGAAVAPFDTTEATAFSEIATIAATYSRVSIDLSTITADWDDYSKVTITYDLIQVGGTDLGVIFRNGTGGGSDPTVNATSSGYATTLESGNGKTVTLPIGEGGGNIKPSVSGNLAVVKNNSGQHCILLRISKIELGD